MHFLKNISFETLEETKNVSLIRILVRAKKVFTLLDDSDTTIFTNFLSRDKIETNITPQGIWMTSIFKYLTNEISHLAQYLNSSVSYCTSKATIKLLMQILLSRFKGKCGPKANA